MRKHVVLLLALLGLPAGPAGAQSLFNAAGIGLPVDALDGRARALGSSGIGLRGAYLMPSDPAAQARLVLPTGVMVGQPSWVEHTGDDGSSGSFQGNRFPLLGIAYPVFSGIMSVQIGSFLDQDFLAESSGSVDLQGATIGTVDRFRQDGAVSSLSLTYGRMFGPRLAAGAGIGRYAGSVVRSLTRSFDASADIEDYVDRGKWSYTGYSLTVGASADVSDIVRVAASVQLPTALDAEGSPETDGEDGRFDLPTQLRVGASGQLAPGLVIHASGQLVDWSPIAQDLREASSAGSAHGFGVGLELSRARLLGRQAPLRFGFRRTALPFALTGDDASERVFSGGLGLALNETSDILLAGVDLALERGRRSGGGVTESFWRATISLVVSGS